MDIIAPRSWGRIPSHSPWSLRIAMLIVMALGLLVATSAHADPPLSGAIFTTDVGCTGVDLNIYTDKGDVYIDGGPSHPGSASLPDGEYYVKVTQPDGTLLGTSIGSGDDTPVTVSGGAFASCYQLSAILIRASNSSPGYDDTGNPGGEYKAWVCNNPEFTESGCKTDNFKVKSGGTVGDTATLRVIKFYDANANGVNDDAQPITGWKVRIQDTIDLIRFTPVAAIVDPDDYTVTEFDPVEANWLHTTPTLVNVTLAANDDKTVAFGNVCLGPGGGHTLGFWSNKNGQAKMNDNGSLAPELALLSGLNLRDAAGGNFNPATYAQFRAWLLGANATNMAYMLSAQLAAMALNVEAGFVNGGSLVWSGTSFVTINALISAADAALAADGYTPAGDANRVAQEALKNTLDAANNNQNFVQPSPCPFSFSAE